MLLSEAGGGGAGLAAVYLYRQGANRFDTEAYTYSGITEAGFVVGGTTGVLPVMPAAAADQAAIRVPVSEACTLVGFAFGWDQAVGFGGQTVRYYIEINTGVFVGPFDVVLPGVAGYNSAFFSTGVGGVALASGDTFALASARVDAVPAGTGVTDVVNVVYLTA
jgi:hypothetical protein